MIQGADKMIQMRIRGIGFRSAWLYIGDYKPDGAQKRFPWWQEKTPVPNLYLKAASGAEDLRPFLGVFTIVTAERYSEALFVFCERLQTYAKTVWLLIDEWEIELGNILVFNESGKVTLEVFCG